MMTKKDERNFTKINICMKFKEAQLKTIFDVIESKIKGIEKDKAIDIISTYIYRFASVDDDTLAKQVYDYAVQKWKDAEDEFHMEDRSKPYFSDVFEV